VVAGSDADGAASAGGAEADAVRVELGVFFAFEDLDDEAERHPPSNVCWKPCDGSEGCEGKGAS
jgi:hypothetical protein